MPAQQPSPSRPVGYTVRLLKSGRFQAVVRDPSTGKQVGIGSFPSEEDAIKAAESAAPEVIARRVGTPTSTPPSLSDAIAVAVLGSVGPGATVADVKRITKAVVAATDAWFLNPIARTKPRHVPEQRDEPAPEAPPAAPERRRKTAPPVSASGRIRPEREL